MAFKYLRFEYLCLDCCSAYVRDVYRAYADERNSADPADHACAACGALRLTWLFVIASGKLFFLRELSDAAKARPALVQEDRSHTVFNYTALESRIEFLCHKCAHKYQPYVMPPETPTTNPAVAFLGYTAQATCWFCGQLANGRSLLLLSHIVLRKIILEMTNAAKSQGDYEADGQVGSSATRSDREAR